jgi:hypothetical protein
MQKVLSSKAIPGNYLDSSGNEWQIKLVGSEAYSIQIGNELLAEKASWPLSKLEDEFTGYGGVLYCDSITHFNVYPNGLSLLFKGSWVHLTKSSSL